MLVDTHAHLNFPDFEKDLKAVVERSLKNGVGKIICVSSSLKDSVKAVEIAQKYKGIVYAAVGIHPNQTDFQEKIPVLKQIVILKKLLKEKGVVAIGESGLDYSGVSGFEENRNQSDQIFLFQEQIKLAREEKLPLLVHSRKALPQVLEILTPFKGKISGALHCYSGGKKDIQKIEEFGFYFGLDGNLTYDSGLQNVAKEIPLEKMLLETDCPFLAPEPYRGLRSEPGHVKIIAEFVAQLKQVTFKQAAQVTTQNAQKLFSKI